jgi:hypothetical protein
MVQDLWSPGGFCTVGEPFRAIVLSAVSPAAGARQGPRQRSRVRLSSPAGCPSALDPGHALTQSGSFVWHRRGVCGGQRGVRQGELEGGARSLFARRRDRCDAGLPCCAWTWTRFGVQVLAWRRLTVCPACLALGGRARQIRVPPPQGRRDVQARHVLAGSCRMRPGPRKGACQRQGAPPQRHGAGVVRVSRETRAAMPGTPIEAQHALLTHALFGAATSPRPDRSWRRGRRSTRATDPSRRGSKSAGMRRRPTSASTTTRSARCLWRTTSRATLSWRRW